MPLARLDHIVVSATDLATGAAHVAQALGQVPSGGGAHQGRGTHNRLLSLGPESYLEVIAPNPDDPAPAVARMFDLDHFTGPPRLTNWVLRTDDMDAAMAQAPQGQGQVEALSRGAFRWRMSVPERGQLPFGGVFPGLIAWQGEGAAPALPDTGCRLARLTIAHPDAPALKEALAPFLDDSRVEIVSGPPGFTAEIDTPSGRRVLR